MKRGQVWLARLDPAQGSEANKVRPVIIVSRDDSNDVVARLQRGVLTVVPITSNVAHVYSFQVLLLSGSAGLDRPCKVQAEQIRTIDVSRLTARLGVLHRDQMLAVDNALRLHLTL